MTISLSGLQQRKKNGVQRVMVVVYGDGITAATDVTVTFEITKTYPGNPVQLTPSQPSGLSCAVVAESGHRLVTARAYVKDSAVASAKRILNFDKDVDPTGAPDPGPCPDESQSLRDP